MSDEKKLSKLEESIKNRANERIQARIKEFKNAVVAACNNLLPHSASAWNYSNHVFYENTGQVFLKVLLSENKTKGWPKELWETEEAKVQEEVFRVMDEVQKIHLSRAPLDTDDKPAEDAND